MNRHFSSTFRTAVLLSLGGLTGWGHAPLNWWWIPFLSFPALLYILKPLSGWAAFRATWVFCFGYFLFGLYWIAHALFVDIGQFWWALPLAAAGLPMVLASFQAVAGVVAQRHDGLPRLLVFAAVWGAMEWVRGHIFTGFPWLLLGQLWVDVAPARQLAALGGAYFLSLWAVVLAVLPAAEKGQRLNAALAGSLLFLLAGGFAHMPLARSSGEALTLRLVQPNIPQTLKIDPESRAASLAQLIELTKYPDQPTVTIWPETAVLYRIAERDDVRALVSSGLGPGHILLTGAPRQEGGEYFNSLLAVNDGAEILGHYDKAHLVPFGEYIPFRSILPFDPVAGGTDFSAGSGSRTLDIAGVPGFSPLICYEGIFPGAVAEDNNPPRWLLNITNDGWYGLTHGPYQHFEIARLRAMEEGVPLVRVANTGISGVVDAQGNVVASLPLGTQGVLDVTVRLDSVQTIYRMAGDWLFWGSVAILLLTERRKKLLVV
jgi:apolipoprotein N-acyltransferase